MVWPWERTLFHLGIIEEGWVRNLHRTSWMTVAHQLDPHQSQSLGVQLGHLLECDLVAAVNDPVLRQALLHHHLSTLLAGWQSRPLQDGGWDPSNGSSFPDLLIKYPELETCLDQLNHPGISWSRRTEPLLLLWASAQLSFNMLEDYVPWHWAVCQQSCWTKPPSRYWDVIIADVQWREDITIGPCTMFLSQTNNTGKSTMIILVLAQRFSFDWVNYFLRSQHILTWSLISKKSNA